MNRKIFNKLIATFLTILLVAGVIAPLAEPIAVATDINITGDFEDDKFLAAVRRKLGIDDDAPIYAGAVALIEVLDASGLNIADLAGIQHFTGLQKLDVSNNRLTELDVSNSPALRILSAADNDIRTPELGNLLFLETLDLSGNRILSFDVSGLSALGELNLRDNAVTSLTFGAHPNLTTLNLSVNRLVSLDISALTALKNLNAGRNALTSIIFGAHPGLETLDLSRNELTTLDISTLAALQNLNISGNSLAAIAFGSHPNLTTLDLSGNMLTNLNVSTLAALQSLDVGRNSLTAITLGNLTNLRTLNVSSNQLTTLDVSRLPALRSLRAWRNSLTTIDLSNLSELRYLDITRNNFRTITMIVGLENTMIRLIIEGESWYIGETEHGFFFHPQITDITGWPFDDVHPQDWFYDYVFWAFDNGITTGIGGTNEFRPRNPVTRSQFVTFLHRVAGEPSVAGGHGFSDVPEGRYFTMPVTWASRVGITAGIGGTTQFRPTTNITREQIVTMLYRDFGSPRAPTNALDNFLDSNSVSAWALDAMRWAVDNGIIQGDRGRLLPLNYATRAETVAMLHRAYG